MNARKTTAVDQTMVNRHSFWESLGLVASADHAQLAHRIAKDLATLGLFWPAIILVKLAAIGFLMATADFGVEAFGFSALAILASSLIADLSIFGFARVADQKKVRPHIQLRFISVAALVSSTTFAGLLVGLFAFSAGPLMAAYALVFHCIVTMVVTVIAGKQRFVGLAFSLGLAITLFNSLPLLAFAASLAIYAVSFSLATFAHIKRDHLDHLALQKDQQDEKRARLILNAYEKASLGWFWETDRKGRLTYISDSICNRADERFGDLIGMSLNALIKPSDGASDSSGERTLGFHLSSRSAFKEIAVESAIFDEERWWSISGNPIVNSFGQFQGFRGSGTDLTEMRRSQEEVKQLAQFDSLTGLSNRLQMQSILEKAIVGHNGEVRPCALFLLDLDRFKTVNDTLGHPAGDALLKLVSQRLQRTIGSDGHAGRLGGDEFKVVLPGATDRKFLAGIANAIISALSEPYSIEGKQVVIGASLGIALAPEHGGTTQALVRNADLALYAAKDAGRGVHKFYDKTMHADAEDRRNIEQDLRQALKNNEMYLVYQPQVSTATQHISGFEALVRWQHPVRGNVSPAVFIPIAEEAGLISQIGEWVLRTACFEVAQWPEHVKIAVNVSSIQFANPSFPAIVTNALASSRLSPDRLELEITESVFLGEGANTDQMFASLKALGCRLSLDDFGTGYSSLGYLKNAPFDKIKIDQGFVRGASIPGNRNAAIIKSIVSLAEALDMETIAEGAETHDELDLIRSLGCSHVQGYIYSKPLKAEDAQPLTLEDAGPMVPTGHKSSRPPRRKMLRSVALLHDNYRYDAQIRNISGRGALIIGLWQVPAGTEFIVEFSPNYRSRGVAQWSEDENMGIEFEEAIDFDKLAGAMPIKKSEWNAMAA